MSKAAITARTLVQVIWWRKRAQGNVLTLHASKCDYNYYRSVEMEMSDDEDNVLENSVLKLFFAKERE